MRHLFILFFFILSNLTYSNIISSFGTPYIQNYTKFQYKAGNQNWSIAQAKDGTIYCANSSGLLVYDGAHWDLYPVKNGNDLRSVAISPNGEIYVGGKEEFGVFKKENGKLTYTRLSDLVEEKSLNNDDIWKIFFHHNSVVFQSFSKLFIYDNNKIEIKHGEGQPFLFSHKLNDQTWIEKIPSGLQAWKNKTFYNLKNKISDVLTILPFEDNNYLIGTAKNGLYLLYSDGSIRSWLAGTYLNKVLQEAQINNGLKLKDNSYAIGTIKNGIFIIDKQGNIIQHLHKRNGLQNNTILSLALDQQGNIWAGLDNGIDRIEINSPFYYFKDIYGDFGTVYAIKVFKKHIYVGTNQGLFFSPWDEQHKRNLDLKFIPETQGQVWTLDIINNQLICGHNNGTFTINEGSVKKISNWTGGWVNKPSQNNINVFVQGNYTGLAIFRNTNKWQFDKKFTFPNEAVLDMHKKDNAYYWIVYNNNVQLTEFINDYDSLRVVNEFSFKTDLPQIQNMRINLLENNIVFGTDKGFFIYDNVLRKFKSYTELNSKLGSYATSHKIVKTGPNKYIFANKGKFAKVVFDKEHIKIDSTSFNKLQNMVMKGYEIIEPFQQKIFFGLDNGIAIYDPSPFKDSKILAPLIKGFNYLNNTSDTLITISEINRIPYKNNSLRVLFSSPHFSSSPIRYQYILSGLMKEWSLPTESTFFDLNNLKYGTYNLSIRAITQDNFVSPATEVQFRILAPWYLSWPAIFTYVVLTVILFFTVKKSIERKIATDKARIRSEFNEQQQKLLQEEAEQNERKLMQLKNKQLAQELELKSRELANAATNILFKNDLLNNLNEELILVKDKEGNKLSSEQLKKVNKLITDARSDERDWDLFEKSFNESHGNFFKKLKIEYPSLSPNDLKLCAYLRLNMSSKDIASLINISIRGVEIRRYRLRKKFNLPTEKNLNEFLIEL